MSSQRGQCSNKKDEVHVVFRSPNELKNFFESTEAASIIRPGVSICIQLIKHFLEIVHAENKCNQKRDETRHQGASDGISSISSTVPSSLADVPSSLFDGLLRPDDTVDFTFYNYKINGGLDEEASQIIANKSSTVPPSSGDTNHSFSIIPSSPVIATADQIKRSGDHFVKCWREAIRSIPKQHNFKECIYDLSIADAGASVADAASARRGDILRLYLNRVREAMQITSLMLYVRARDKDSFKFVADVVELSRSVRAEEVYYLVACLPGTVVLGGDGGEIEGVET